MDYGEKIKEIKFGKLFLLSRFLIAVFLLLISLGGIYLELTFFQQENTRPVRVIQVYFLTIATSLICICDIISIFKILLKKKPSLIIHKNGVFCYIPLTYKNFIPWDNIKDIYFTKNKQLQIDVKDIDRYTEKMSWIKKELLGYGFFGSNPSTVFKRNIKDFDIDIKDFEETIKTLWKP